METAGSAGTAGTGLAFLILENIEFIMLSFLVAEI